MNSLSGISQSEGGLLHCLVPSLYVGHRSADEIDRSLFFMQQGMKQYNANRPIRYCKVHVQLLFRLRVAQNGGLCKVMFDFIE